MIAIISAARWFCRSDRYYGFHPMSPAHPSLIKEYKYDLPEKNVWRKHGFYKPESFGRNEYDLREDREWKIPVSQFSELTDSTAQRSLPLAVQSMGNRSELSP